MKEKEIKIIKVVDLTKFFKSDLEKFLKDQQIIAFLLVNLIESYCKLADKRFKEWIEKKTLGELIQIFKIIAIEFENKTFRIGRPQGYTIKEVIKELEDYNKMRNQLIHKIVQPPFKTRKEILNLTKETNAGGKIIITILGDLSKEQITKSIRKVGKQVRRIMEGVRKNTKKLYQ